MLSVFEAPLIEAWVMEMLEVEDRVVVVSVEGRVKVLDAED